MSKVIPIYDDYAMIGRTRMDATIALANSDPMLIRRGLVNGASVVHKFGRNDAVPNGSWGGILQAAAQFHWLQAATTVRIKAGGDVADTAAGTGAREVVVQGLNASGVEVSEAIATNGTSASAYTTTEFLRVYRAWVSAAGTYTGANTDTVVIEDGSNDLIAIAAGEGQTQFCGYTIPAGKTGYLASVVVHADATKAADFRLFTRADADTVAAPFPSKRLKYYWDGVIGDSVAQPFTPLLKLPAMTDIWIEARGASVTEASADMEIILYDD